MWFRLALALGMTVQELRQRMSGKEFVEWCAYYQMEPWGEERADLRAGIISSTVANVNRVKGRAFRPDDFMPKFGRRSSFGRVQSAQEMHAQVLKACQVN